MRVLNPPYRLGKPVCRQQHLSSFVWYLHKDLNPDFIG